MDGFLHFLVIHESTQRIRVFLIGKCQCPLSGRRLNFFKRRIAILVNEVCDNGNVGIIARSRYDRQAIYQSGQSVSQGFELPAEFLPMQMEIRMIVCVPATEIAALRRTEQDLARLWDCLERFESAPYGTPEEEEAHGKWEALLHHLETEAAHNPFLSRINESISALIERNNSIMHHFAIQDRERFRQIMTQHRQIIAGMTAFISANR